MSNRVVITGVDLSFDDAAKLWLQFLSVACLFAFSVGCAVFAAAICLLAFLVSQGITHLPLIR